MILKYLDNSEDLLKWNDFIDKSPQGSIFAHSWYLDALNVNYKILCVIDNNNELMGGIVLAKNQIKTYSNPMLDKYLGLVLKDKQVNVTQKILSSQFKVIDLITTELKKYKSFDYYFHPEFKNWTGFYWKGFTQQTRFTYIINLSLEIEQIKSGFHTNTKRNIKNAIKMGVEIRNDIDFESFYKIIDKTFLRQGSKAPFNKNDMQNYIEELKKVKRFVSFGAFDKNGKLISVCGIVFDNKSSYLLLNGVDVENEVRGANALMILDSISYFKDKCLFYDFEGSMLPGIEQFYRRFGGELVPYMRIWNDNIFNFLKSFAKKKYKQIRYGR